MNSQEIEKYLDERRAAIETRKKDSTTKMIINDSPDYFALEVDDLIKEGWEIVGSPFIIQGSTGESTSYNYRSYSPTGTGTVRQNFCVMMRKGK